MKAETEEGANAYNQVPYPSRSYRQTHPHHLAVMGELFGLSPVPIDGCRVLEIGCGEGVNLISMAFDLPRSKFFGFDFAEDPITRGRRRIQKLGLHNISLEHMNLMNFKAPSGAFDYVIAHGFYSWVAPRVQEKLLEVCGDVLSPNGIAFVSYNCYPGAHIRSMLREMMLFHTDTAADPRIRISQARALMRFLAGGNKLEGEYSHPLAKELDQVQQRSDGALYHDELAEWNQPCYFYEFSERAARHGLQFLAEAEYHMMQTMGMPDEIRNALAGLEDDRLLREQYLDFLHCRQFRQSLLSRSGISVRSNPDPAAFRRLRSASQARPLTTQTSSDSEAVETYTTERGGRMASAHPVFKAVMSVLTQAWPRSLEFSALIAGVEEFLSQSLAEKDIALVEDVLIQAYSLAMIELRSQEPRFSAEAGDRPTASPIARLQLEEGEIMTNLLGGQVAFDDPVLKQLILLVDGTRNRAELASELHKIQGHADNLEEFLKYMAARCLLL